MFSFKLMAIKVLTLPNLVGCWRSGYIFAITNVKSPSSNRFVEWIDHSQNTIENHRRMELMLNTRHIDNKITFTLFFKPRLCKNWFTSGQWGESLWEPTWLRIFGNQPGDESLRTNLVTNLWEPTWRWIFGNQPGDESLGTNLATNLWEPTWRRIFGNQPGDESVGTNLATNLWEPTWRRIFACTFYLSNMSHKDFNRKSYYKFMSEIKTRLNTYQKSWHLLHSSHKTTSASFKNSVWILVKSGVTFLSMELILMILSQLVQQYPMCEIHK